jgi:hypothetical protein
MMTDFCFRVGFTARAAGGRAPALATSREQEDIGGWTEHFTLSTVATTLRPSCAYNYLVGLSGDHGNHTSGVCTTAPTSYSTCATAPTPHFYHY